jgi:hypothetical protein
MSKIDECVNECVFCCLLVAPVMNKIDECVFCFLLVAPVMIKIDGCVNECVRLSASGASNE